MKREEIIKIGNFIVFLIVFISLIIYYGEIRGIELSFSSGESIISSSSPSFSILENQSGFFLNVTNHFPHKLTVTVGNDTVTVMPHRYGLLKLNDNVIKSSSINLEIRYLKVTMFINASL